MINFYSIRSKSSGLFDTPWPCENDKRAIYELRYMINQKPTVSAIANDPGDHELHRVGLFDCDSGKMKHQNDCLIKDLSVLVKKEGKDG